MDGLYWWWPETCEYGINWQNAVTPSGWYNAGLWDNSNGRALAALYELHAFRTDDTGIHSSPFTPHQTSSSQAFDLLGRRLTDGNNSPIIIRNGKKLVEK